MGRTAKCVALAVVGGIGCGTGALPEEEVPLPDALTCASTSWSVVHTFAETSLVPSNLALRDDVFYISIGDWGIVALPKAGGDEVLLTTETARNLSIEGDSIYFGKNNDKLWRLPLAGGTPAVVVDGMTAYVEPDYGVPADIALDALVSLLGPVASGGSRHVEGLACGARGRRRGEAGRSAVARSSIWLANADADAGHLDRCGEHAECRLRRAAVRRGHADAARTAGARVCQHARGDLGGGCALGRTSPGPAAAATRRRI